MICKEMRGIKYTCKEFDPLTHVVEFEVLKSGLGVQGLDQSNLSLSTVLSKGENRIVWIVVKVDSRHTLGKNVDHRDGNELVVQIVALVERSISWVVLGPICCLYTWLLLFEVQLGAC